MIGTPFISEDEITQRKVDKINKKPWEQEVRDEKGRKRLHGAFTGGFSAGYFNTVGSKEGWSTSQFRSSRSEKTIITTEQNSRKKQDVMDFMDEEDIKDQIGEVAITSQNIHKDYLHSLKPNNKYEEEDFREEQFFNNDINSVKEFIPQFNNMIGNMLMQESGFSETEFQINAYGNDYNVFKNNDILGRPNTNLRNNENENNKYYKGKLEFKDDYYGVGYIPLIEDDIFTSKKSNDYKGSGNSKNIIRMDKFEENDDYGFYINSNIDKEKYNFEILDDHYLNEKEKELRKKRLRENIDTDFDKTTQKFIKSDTKLHSVEIYEFKMPVLPKDYDPFTKINQNQSFDNKEPNKTYNLESEINKLNNSTGIANKHPLENKEKIYVKLDANKRSEILDLDLEIKPIISESANPYFQNKFTKAEVFDFKNPNDDKLLYNINASNNNKNQIDTSNYNKSAPSTVEQFNNYFHLKIDIPFKEDVSKIARFAKFVAEKEGLIMGDNTYNLKNNLMSAIDSKIERELFEGLYKEELRLRKQEQISKSEIKNPHLSETDELKSRIEKIKNREIKREKFSWKPEKILCKRFKLKDPFENKINSIINTQNGENKNDNNNITFKKGDVKYSMSSLQYQLFRQENPNLSSADAKKGINDQNKDIKKSNNESNVFNVINAKTDVNLFEEIFND